MEIVLIRHSKTKPMPNIPIPLWGLTEEGIAKAKSLANEPIIKTLDVIYSSLQTKAIETALLLAKPNNLPIKTNNALTEISSFTREFLGDSYEQAVSDFYSDKISRIAHGETATEALTRFEQALQEIVFGLEKTIKKLNKENEKLTRTINKISKLFQINTNDPYHLLLFLKDFKTKSKKVTKLVKELENLWILEKNQHNEIVISPKIISYLKEFKENKLVTPKIKNKKTFYVNTNIVIKKDNQIHKIKKYRMNKIEDKEKEKLKNEVTNLENDLKEKNNKISYLEQENQKLKEKLAEKEKFIKEQNKKIEELIQKLENLEKTENNQTLTKEQIEALKAYKEYQKN